MLKGEVFCECLFHSSASQWSASQEFEASGSFRDCGLGVLRLRGYTKRLPFAVVLLRA